ncbi:MAG: preprotein translocase subunit SecA, partial [Desulfurivibrionaceae bacterium]|nr:preprotein translocase subunit SecA [Desulfurivibrionaceae bacterium]
MIGSLLTKIFGSKNERVLKELNPLVEAINAIEPEIKKLDDAALAAKTVEFKERLGRGESLDDLLVEAFAVVREAAWRTVAMRPFDVQLIG